MKKILIDEATLKQVIAAIKKCHYYMIDAGLPNQSRLVEAYEAYAALEAALAKQPAPAPAQQEPVGNEWTPCMKLPVVVHVRKQRPGEAHVSTREGITPVNPDDLIMRGVSGEEYPIGRAIFEQTYSLEIKESTSPPYRKWIGLTQEQIESCYGGEIDDFARAIEAKLKELNT